jgi:hypothetical protein
MKTMAVMILIVLLFSASAIAQEEILKTRKAQEKKFDNNFDNNNGKIETATFYGSVVALWSATAMDIYSGNSLDKNRFHETNPLGGTTGQLITSGVATGAAFLIRHYGNKHMGWLASSLLAGTAAAHAYGAAHNFGLR